MVIFELRDIFHNAASRVMSAVAPERTIRTARFCQAERISVRNDRGGRYSIPGWLYRWAEARSVDKDSYVVNVMWQRRHKDIDVSNGTGKIREDCELYNKWNGERVVPKEVALAWLKQFEEECRSDPACYASVSQPFKAQHFSRFLRDEPVVEAENAI